MPGLPKFRNPLRNLFRPKNVFILGVSVTALGILVVAKIFAWSLLLAFLLVLALLLVAVIVILVRQLRAVRRAEEIEKTIHSQADRDIERSTPGQLKENQTLKADLIAAIEALKKTRSGKNGESVLSTLPWYMLMGPRAAGKSELMARSGLHFPLQDAARRGRAVKGIGGTRSFEWWLSQEAVVLDMGGRAFAASAQFEDTDDWFAFLDVLRQQRPGKPLNGVVVTMPVDQLVDRPDAQVDQVAGGVRDRIAELVSRLGVVFPVYVVFSKIDLVAGFAEFFDDLPAAERQQPWGATIALAASRERSAEELFDEEYDQLLGALGDRRLRRLASIPDPIQRARAFVFPAQLERLRPGLARFLRGVFAPDPTQPDAALFRGFYLASTTQEGTPVDRVLEPQARQLGIVPAESPAPPRTSGAYFLNGLLTDVVFPDAELAGTSRAESQRRTWAQRVALLGVGIGYLAVLITLLVLAAMNGGLLRDTRRAAEAVARDVSESSKLMDKLQPLDRLRARLATLQSYRRGTPWWRALGGYSGGALVEPGVRLWADRAVESLAKPSVELMQRDLAGLVAAPGGEFADTYVLFRAWRLLQAPTQMDTADARLVTRAVQRVLEQDVVSVPTDLRPQVPGLIERQIAFMAANKAALEEPARRYLPLDDAALLAAGTRMLKERWDSGSFYRQLQEEAGTGLPPLGLAGLVKNLRVVSNPTQVPGLYTLGAWKDRVKPRVEWWRENTKRDYVLSDAFAGSPPDLAEDLTRAYAKDYTNAWANFLQSLRAEVVEGDPVRRIAAVLQTCKEKDSPVLEVLRGVGRETLLGAESQVGLNQVRADFEMLHAFFETPSREKQGQLLQRLQRAAASAGRMIGIGGKSARVDLGSKLEDQYVDKLRKAYDEVAALPPGTGISKLQEAASVQVALGWIEEASTPYADLRGTPATVTVLRLPISEVKGGIDLGTQRELSQLFSGTVRAEFDLKLAGRYPFTRGSAECSPFEFNQFFKSGGTFWSFYAANLQRFVNPDGSEAPDGSIAAVPAEVLAFLRMAYRVRQAFYATDPEAAGLAFTVKTSQDRFTRPGGVNTPWISFDVGGVPARYDMGPALARPLRWPGDDPQAGAALRVFVSGANQAVTLREERVWGVFRLLDGRTTSLSPQAVRATFRVEVPGGTMSIPYEIESESPQNPFAPGFFRVE
jgi:type VI secretion system protein ImpL